MVQQVKEVKVIWRGESVFEGINPAQASVQMGSFDGKPGISPMEMLLLGLAGCTATDVVSILQKKRQNLTELQIYVRGTRAETHPRIYTEIEIVFYIWGDKIEPQAVERAIELSEEKYCSVSAMLRQSTQISSRYQILAPGESIEEFFEVSAAVE